MTRRVPAAAGPPAWPAGPGRPAPGGPSRIIYYLRRDNGAGKHVVYKLSGADGSLLWSSQPIAAPRYASFFGEDHLIVGPGAEAPAVFVIAGQTWSLDDCTWVARLDGGTGERQWWLNGTSAITDAVLSSDGARLYTLYINGSVAQVDAPLHGRRGLDVGPCRR